MMPSPVGDNKDVLAFRNINSNKIPLVPPMEADTASAKSANSCEGWSSLNFPDCNRWDISVAPLCMVIPQSPSPTIVSYLVRRGSETIKASQQERRTTLATFAKLAMRTGGRVALPLSSFVDATPGTSSISASEGRAAPSVQESTLAQAGASVSTSMNVRTSLVFKSPINGITETDAPCISKEVMKLPTNTLVALHPASFSS
mmetsp:Transcript_473/g.932  ORF Transcript_473/g.932 Transcript_473/m.932 type:complete len:202 (-) Transcript_473:486-1091(-)